MAPTSRNNSSVSKFDWSGVNLHKKGPSDFEKFQARQIAKIRAQELASDPLYSAQEKKTDVYPTVSSMTLPDKPIPEQIPSKINHILDRDGDHCVRPSAAGDSAQIVSLSQRENWLVISDRFNPSKILEAFHDKRVIKIVGIKNYANARPRIDLQGEAEANLESHRFHMDHHSNVLYLRYTGMGGQADVGSINTIGFYESVLKVLKHLGAVNYIWITDAWPLPTPRHLHTGDKVHMNQLLVRAQKIVVNTNQAGAKKCNTNTLLPSCDTFIDMTKPLGFNQVTVKRRCVMSVYQHNIIKALVTMTQVSSLKQVFAGKEIHNFLCNNISPPLNISNDDVQVTRKNLDWLQEKGYITRESVKIKGVYVYKLSSHNMQLYESSYPEMSAQLSKA